ncbi:MULTISPECIES: four-carbon acid sugar kinase family protein [Clostridia]|uniref:four-carbon acid sugar kinase family protein n=1 Tax=Clostridia TaxID=186801 RepID=UPI000EA2486B|nr:MULTISPECIES: four-carbon acid sugar kinase family protein [Clostridia]NBJ71318.1 hypothetical protein [Roseburia sp. 1XD42-34]RKI74725.1 hypothetical protein D7V87_18100 [Clostridium sp. 1xD42-85]
MKRQIGIIADDLTGANDSGVQLAERGIKTSVYFQLPKQEKQLNNSIVIDTNSRALTRENAIKKTKNAAQFLKQENFSYIYKKMDSTLRGHIGAEIKVLDEVFRPEFMFIAPAYPRLGRTTVNGVHYVNHIPIAESEVSKDPKHPVKDSSIIKVLQKEVNEKMAVLTTDMIHTTKIFNMEIENWKQSGVRYVICDAQTQMDLYKAAVKMAAITQNIVWAGSAGLAEALPLVLSIDGGEQTPTNFDNNTQVMTVCSSLSQVTQTQVAYAKEQPNVSGVEINTIDIFQNDWHSHKVKYIKRCTDAFAKGKDVVLYVPSDDEIRRKVKKVASELQLSPEQVGEKISGAIGEIAAYIAESTQRLSGLVLTGGDTAKATAKCLGGEGINLVKQVEPGIPLGELIGTQKTYYVVTKAGSFGAEESIYRAMQALKGVNENDK